MACFRKCIVGSQDKTVILHLESCNWSVRKSEHKRMKVDIRIELYICFLILSLKENKPSVFCLLVIDSPDGYPSVISV